MSAGHCCVVGCVCFGHCCLAVKKKCYRSHTCDQLVPSASLCCSLPLQAAAAAGRRFRHVRRQRGHAAQASGWRHVAAPQVTCELSPEVHYTRCPFIHVSAQVQASYPANGMRADSTAQTICSCSHPELLRLPCMHPSFSGCQQCRQLAIHASPRAPALMAGSCHLACLLLSLLAALLLHGCHAASMPWRRRRRLCHHCVAASAELPSCGGPAAATAAAVTAAAAATAGLPGSPASTSVAAWSPS